MMTENTRAQADGEGPESADEMEPRDPNDLDPHIAEWQRGPAALDDDADDEDEHPDCDVCQGKGFVGWGYGCTVCGGMGSLGWSQSDIDNEMERRGMDAERRASEGPTYREQRAHVLDQLRGIDR